MTDTNGRRPILDKSSLIPAGVVIGLIGLAWAGGVAWSERGARLVACERRIEAVEQMAKLNAAKLEIWRRVLERKLGELPDPTAVEPEPEPPRVRVVRMKRSLPRYGGIDDAGR